MKTHRQILSLSALSKRVVISLSTFALLWSIGSTAAAPSANQSTPTDAPTVQITFTNCHSSATSIDYQYSFSLELEDVPSSETLSIEGYAGLGYITLPINNCTNTVSDTGLEEEELAGEYYNPCTCTMEEVRASWEDIAADGNEIDDGTYVWEVQTALHTFDLIRAYDSNNDEVDFSYSVKWVRAGGVLTCEVKVSD